MTVVLSPTLPVSTEVLLELATISTDVLFSLGTVSTTEGRAAVLLSPLALRPSLNDLH